MINKFTISNTKAIKNVLLFCYQMFSFVGESENVTIHIHYFPLCLCRTSRIFSKLQMLGSLLTCYIRAGVWSTLAISKVDCKNNNIFVQFTSLKQQPKYLAWFVYIVIIGLIIGSVKLSVIEPGLTLTSFVPSGFYYDICHLLYILSCLTFPFDTAYWVYQFLPFVHL